MSVFSIEVLLALLGLLIVLASAFLPKVADRTLAWTGIAGCVVALLLLAGASRSVDSLPAFVAPYYSLDTLSLFYKGFALVITALVLWLVAESEKTLSAFSLDGRLGEMIGLPLIVCTGQSTVAQRAVLERRGRGAEAVYVAARGCEKCKTPGQPQLPGCFFDSAKFPGARLRRTPRGPFARRIYSPR